MAHGKYVMFLVRREKYFSKKKKCNQQAQYLGECMHMDLFQAVILKRAIPGTLIICLVLLVLLSVVLTKNVSAGKPTQAHNVESRIKVWPKLAFVSLDDAQFPYFKVLLAVEHFQLHHPHFYTVKWRCIKKRTCLEDWASNNTFYKLYLKSCFDEMWFVLCAILMYIWIFNLADIFPEVWEASIREKGKIILRYMEEKIDLQNPATSQETLLSQVLESEGETKGRREEVKISDEYSRELHCSKAMTGRVKHDNGLHVQWHWSTSSRGKDTKWIQQIS